MNRGFIKEPAKWKADQKFIDELLKITAQGKNLKRYLAANYPELNHKAVLKHLNAEPIRKAYREARNRYLLGIEWQHIRNEAEAEAEETGVDVERIYRLWKVDCDINEYRKGEEGDKRWAAVVIEKKRKAKAKARELGIDVGDEDTVAALS